MTLPACDVISLAQECQDDGIIEATAEEIRSLAWWANIHGVDIAYPIIEWADFVGWLHKEARKYEVVK